MDINSLLVPLLLNQLVGSQNAPSGQATAQIPQGRPSTQAQPRVISPVGISQTSFEQTPQPAQQRSPELALMDMLEANKGGKPSTGQMGKANPITVPQNPNQQPIELNNYWQSIPDTSWQDTLKSMSPNTIIGENGKYVATDSTPNYDIWQHTISNRTEVNPNVQDFLDKLAKPQPTVPYDPILDRMGLAPTTPIVPNVKIPAQPKTTETDKKVMSWKGTLHNAPLRQGNGGAGNATVTVSTPLYSYTDADGKIITSKKAADTLPDIDHAIAVKNDPNSKPEQIASAKATLAQLSEDRKKQNGVGAYINNIYNNNGKDWSNPNAESVLRKSYYTYQKMPAQKIVDVFGTKLTAEEMAANLRAEYKTDYSKEP